jgi:translation elongation factor EF-Tu-like GTPase
VTPGSDTDFFVNLIEAVVIEKNCKFIMHEGGSFQLG